MAAANAQTVSVAVLQMPTTLDIAENRTVLIDAIDRLGPGEVLVTPEGAISGYEEDASFLQRIELNELSDATDSVRQRAVRRCGRDVARQPCAHAVGQSGPCVRLVHDDRGLPASRRKVGRHGDVATESDDDLRTRARDDGCGGSSRCHQPGRHGEHTKVGAAR